MKRVRPPRPASACSFSTLRLNLVLTRGIAPAFRDGVHLLYLQPPSGQSFVYQVTQLFPYRWRCSSAGRGPVSSPQGSPSNRCCLLRYHNLDQFLCASLSPYTRAIGTTQQQQWILCNIPKYFHVSEPAIHLHEKSSVGGGGNTKKRLNSLVYALFRTTTISTAPAILLYYVILSR